jgi:glutamate racemase
LSSSPARGDAPLGVFDSGLGGLTVVRALRRTLPAERIVYLGDTARVPYGTRSAETVLRYARSCAKVLIERGVKGLVVACNTVSAVALEMLRAELDLPVIGVVEPGARAAVEALGALARAGDARIGVLGTAGTIASGAYPRAIGRLTTRVEVVGMAAPLLVPLVEEGWLDGEVPRLAVERYLTPLVGAKARVIVLGCTHYPLLTPVISEVAARLAGAEIAVVDSARATADDVATWIREERIPSAPETGEVASLEVLVTDRPSSFHAVAARFLGVEAPFEGGGVGAPPTQLGAAPPTQLGAAPPTQLGAAPPNRLSVRQIDLEPSSG